MSILKPKSEEGLDETEKNPAAVGSGSTSDKITNSTAQSAAGIAQAEYFAKLARYYRAASRKTLALGIVTTAEGLNRIMDGGIKIEQGDTLVASGLLAIEAGEELKRSEGEALSKIKESAEPKEADSELLEDPLAEEVIADLAEKTGYSRAEVTEKILGSSGSLDALAADFESAISRQREIGLAKGATAEELEAILAESKSGALRKKINLASLREAISSSASVEKLAPTDWKKQWSQPHNNGLALSAGSEKKSVSGRAPASAPEFLNLGENLPSFDLEQGALEEANEISLFEKVHRKYAEIAPSMHRKK